MKQRLQIASQSAKGRSVPLSAEMLTNMYIEQAPGGARNAIVAHGTPGITTFSTIDSELIRGVYYASVNKTLWCVCGLALYKVSSAGTATNIGTIGGYGRVGMADNGTQLMIVTEAIAYVVTLATDTLTTVTDSDYPNADTVASLGGYFFFNNNQSGSKGQFFWSGNYSGTTFDALDFATAENVPDNLVAVWRDHDRLLMFGDLSTESWFLTGDTDIVAPYKGSTINRGLGARWSVANVDNRVIFLDERGVVRVADQSGTRISTHAIEYEISLGAWRHDDTNAYDGAVASAYIEEGHEFYILTIPACGTFVWDAATGVWHKRKSRFLETCRTSFHVHAFDKVLCGDTETGALYEQKLGFYDEANEYLVSEIQFPQIHNDGDRFRVPKLELFVETGAGLSQDEINAAYTTDGPVCNINGPWETQVSAGDSAWSGITYGDKFVAVGGSANPNVMYSSDGETWSATVAGTTNLANVVYTGDSFQSAMDSTNMYDVYIRSDGIKMYVAYSGTFGAYDIREFDLSSQFLLSSATLANQISIPSLTNVIGITFKPDGAMLFVVGTDGLGIEVEAYELSTPWDLSSALKVAEKNISATVANPSSIQFNPAGTLAIIHNTGNSTTYEFSLTAWDITTMSYTSTSVNISTLIGGALGGEQKLKFNTSGTKAIFVHGAGTFNSLSLSTPFDISTMTDDAIAANLAAPVGLGYIHRFTSLEFAGDDATIVATDYGTDAGPSVTSPNDTIYKFTLADPVDLEDVAYGNDTYVAVGADGAVYSATGVTWPTGDLNDTDNWVSVSWFSGASLFIAVADSGTGNLLATTPDGVTWTERTQTTGMNAVAASATIAVVVGDSGIKTSTDGITWASQTEPADNDWQGVCYSAERGRFVAVSNTGTGNRAMYSDNGTDWLSAVSAADYDWNNVTYGAGYFVAIADTGTGKRIMRSQFGIEWELVDSPADNGWNDIAWSGESLCLMAAVSDSGTGNRVMTSAKLTDATSTTEGQAYSALANEPYITLDVSSDGGKTFDITQPWRSMGKQGEFKKRVIWHRLGQHRTFTPRFTISAPVKKVIIAATAEVMPDG